MNIIDQLIVTLGLDATALEKGAERAVAAQKKIGATAGQTAKDIEKQESALDEAQKKRNKELEGRSKLIAQGLSKVRNEALALFAAFTGGKSLLGFVTGTLSAEAGLGRMSANLNMSAQDLAMWQLANERAGGSMQGMTAQLKDASVELARYKTGGGSEKLMKLFQWASRAGVSVDPAALKSGADVVNARAKVLEAMSRIDPSKAMVAAEDIGVSEDTFNLLKQGPAAIEAQRQAQKGLADEMARNAPAAEEFRKKWNDLTHEFEAMAIKILPKLMPVLERLANWLISVIPDIESFAKKINSAVESLGGWTNVLVALGALKILSMTSGLIGLANALVGVGSALGVIGGTVGVAALAALTGIALLTHSGGLNKGEDAELAKRRKMAPTIDGASGGAGGSASVVSQLIGMGWSPAQAAGLAANFQHESGMNPGAVGDGGKAYGIGQWHPDRQAAFKAKYGKDIRGSSVAEQLAFANHELRFGNEQDAGRRLSAAKTAAEAGAIASQYYERPADAAGEAIKRAATAVANLPSGAGAAARASRGGGSNTSTSDVKVGQITIHTQATDATGIAQSIGGALKKFGYVNQPNAGLA
jgi:hypothetical protein